MSKKIEQPEMFDGAMVHPILQNWPDLWWLGETERSIVIELRARQYGGEGYIRSWDERER